jgi:hypothetical protein
MSLLFLYEVVVAAQLLEHIGHHHGAPVGFEEEMGELIVGRSVGEPKGEHRVALDGEPLGLRDLLPKKLAALP